MNEHLKNFPISFFAMIMGLTGAIIAWQRAETLLKWPGYLSTVLLWVSALVFLTVSMIYIAKYYKYRGEIKKEFQNITKLSFFPTISISVLLLSIGAMNLYPALSQAMWVVGAVVHFLFSVTIISIWIRHPSLASEVLQYSFLGAARCAFGHHRASDISNPDGH